MEMLVKGSSAPGSDAPAPPRLFLPRPETYDTPDVETLIHQRRSGGLCVPRHLMDQNGSNHTRWGRQRSAPDEVPQRGELKVLKVRQPEEKRSNADVQMLTFTLQLPYTAT
jgi:hypothetical protein